MSYTVEIREEINTLISYISAPGPSQEDLKHYMEEVVRLQNVVIQKNALRLYHILIIESEHYNLTDGLHVVRAIRQNKALQTARKRINTLTLLVGQTPKALQIMITMIASESGGRQVSVFATLEAALDFVRTDNANHQSHPAE